MIPIEPKLNRNFPEGWRQVIFAKDQKEYLPLPALVENANSGHVITCWKLSWKEKIRLFLTGKLWLTVMTFHQPLQPILLNCNEPEFMDEVR